MPGKTAQGDPGIWFTDTHVGDLEKVPGFCLAVAEYLGSEPANGISFSPSLSLPPSFPSISVSLSPHPQSLLLSHSSSFIK